MSGTVAAVTRPENAHVPPEMPDWLARAAQAAQAMGKVFVLGARPYDKGWFANCDGIEWDGSTPAQAVDSVLESLRRREDASRAEASRQATTAAGRLAALPASPPRSFDAALERHRMSFEADNRGLAAHLVAEHGADPSALVSGVDAGTWSRLDRLHTDAHADTTEDPDGG